MSSSMVHCIYMVYLLGIQFNLEHDINRGNVMELSFDILVLPCWCHFLYNVSCRIRLPIRITDSLHCEY